MVYGLSCWVNQAAQQHVASHLSKECATAQRLCGEGHTPTQVGTCMYVCLQERTRFLETHTGAKPQDASTSSSICRRLRVPGCKAPAFLFSSPIIITHISCRSLLQIFIESPSYIIHRTRHSYSESDREAGHSKERGEGGRGME